MIKLYFILALSITSIFLLVKRKKFNRHSYNWKKAKQIKDKLDTFEGDYKEARILAYLRKIDPFVFEELILYCFHLQGLKIIRNKKYTGDGGIDGKVINDNRKSFVQAKRYSSHINLEHVKEFRDLVKNNSWANHGYFIHTGRTGKGVYDILPYSDITIISGQKLIDLISTKMPS